MTFLKVNQAAISCLEEMEMTSSLEEIKMTHAEFLNLASAPYPKDWGHFSRAWEGLTNDLNVSQATGGIFAGLAALEKAELNYESVLRELKALASVLYALGIQLFQQKEEPALEIPESIRTLAEERWQAKQNRDWEKADTLRTQLLNEGWQILDRKDGYDLIPL